MNWDQLHGEWRQYKGKIKQHWGKLTDDDLDLIAGSRKALIGKIQEYYDLAEDEGEKDADEFVESLTAGDAEMPRSGRLA